MDIGNGSCKVFLFLFPLLYLMFSKIAFENVLNPYIDTPIVGVPHQWYQSLGSFSCPMQLLVQCVWVSGWEGEQNALCFEVAAFASQQP